MTYGSEVLGTSNAELQMLRKLELALVRPAGYGRSRELMLAVAGDAAGFAATSALRRWAREVYDTTAGVSHGAARGFSLKQLRCYWIIAAGAPARNWGEARSPIDAAKLEAKRLGWKFEGPFKLRTDRDVKIDLTEAQAPMLASEVKAGLQRLLERNAALSLTMQGFAGARVAVDHVQKLMARKKGDP